GADIHTTDEEGLSILHTRAQMGIRYEEDEEAVIRLLAKHGADINAADPFGRTPLMTAILESSAPRVKLLLWLGVKTAAQDAGGNRAMDYAVSQGQSEILEMLKRQSRNRRSIHVE